MRPIEARWETKQGSTQLNPPWRIRLTMPPRLPEEETLQRVAVRLYDSALSGHESVLGRSQREDPRRCWARDVKGTGCSHLRSGRNFGEALRKARRGREASYSRQSAR
jgi:hypothetical protein